MKKLYLIVLALYFMVALWGETVSYKIDIDRDNFKLLEQEILSEQEEYLLISSGNNFDIYPEKAGKPYLPKRMINILVPENAEFIQMNYQFTKTVISRDITVYPTQKLVPLSSTEKPVFIHPSEEYYSLDTYPETLAEYTSTQDLSQYRYFTFLVSPFLYNPLKNSLELLSEITLEIEYDRTNPRSEPRWDDGSFARMLSSEIINPQDLASYDQRSPIDPDDVKYLIITSQNLVNSFQPLADWKTDAGVPAEIITTSTIYSQYSGASNQIKIKNCLKDYYDNKGTIWVLLGGDDTIVPDQDCYGKVTTSTSDITDNNMPTDLFYSCFDGAFDWNGDGNSTYGEITDNIDMAPEIIISRAPVRTSAHTTAFVQKTLQYIQNPPSSNFAEKMVICGLELWNTWGGRSDADRRCEIMWSNYIDPVWSGTRYRFYDTNTDFGGASYDVTRTNISSVINNGYNFFFMATHGGQSVWSTESGYYFSSSTASSLSNGTQQGMIATMACITNAFDGSSGYGSDPCLSEAFIRNPNGGAVAYHGSSRYGWGYSNTSDNHGPSLQYADYLYNYLFSGEPSDNSYMFGAVSSQTKIHFIGASSNYGAFRWLQFTLNTIGDPNLDILTYDPEQITITAPESIYVFNPQTITIGTGIPGAKICLNNNEDVYINGICDASGNFSCTPDPVSDNSIVVTVTAHNHGASVATIEVIALAPQLNTDEQSYQVDLDANETEGRTLTVTNAGQAGSILNYSIFVEGESGYNRYNKMEKILKLKDAFSAGDALSEQDLEMLNKYQESKQILPIAGRIAQDCYPQEIAYWSGSTTSSSKTENSELKVYGGGESGWIKFDVSEIPVDSEINSITLNFYVNYTYYPYWSVTPVSVDPASASASTLYSDINNEANSGFYNYQNEDSEYETGWKQLVLGGNAKNDLFASLDNGWFALGMSSRDTYSSYYLEVDGWNESNKPYISVDYTPNVPVLAITSPVGGEIIPVGSSLEITWLHSGAELAEVDIFLSRNNGTSWETIVSDTGNDGSYFWTVDSPISENCLIKISSSDGTVETICGNVFKIYYPVNWLTVSPLEGSVDYNGNDVIVLTFSSASVASGAHNALMTISSNGGNLQIPITLNVDTGLQMPDVETEVVNNGDVITFSWAQVEGATYYKVYSSTDPAAEFPTGWVLEYTGPNLSWQAQATASRMFMRVVSCN